MPPTPPTPDEAQQVLKAALAKRVQDCGEAVNADLEKYKCRLRAVAILAEGAQTTFEYQIVPLE